MTTTVTGVIKAENHRDAEKARSEFSIIIKNEILSEAEKCGQFISLAASINDDGDTSAKVEYELNRDDLEITFNGTLNSHGQWSTKLEFRWEFG